MAWRGLNDDFGRNNYSVNKQAETVGDLHFETPSHSQDKADAMGAAVATGQHRYVCAYPKRVIASYALPDVGAP